MIPASTPELIDLVQDERLPSPPAVASEVLRLTRDDGVSLEQLATVLSKDPVLAAKLLKLANSTLFPAGNPVSSLDAAVVRLGLKTVKLMALSFSLVSELSSRSKGAAFDYRAFWKRSLTQAVAARAIAHAVGSRLGEEAFLAAILGRIGQLALNEVLPERYDRVLVAAADTFPSAEDERLVLGFDHHEVGGALLEKWELPLPIVQAVRFGARPLELPYDTPIDTVELVRLVHVGTVAATVLCEPRKGEAMHALEDALALFGLPPAATERYLVDLQDLIGTAAKVVDIDIRPNRSIEEIVHEARMQMVQISLGTAADLRQTEDRAERLERDKIELERRAHTDLLTGMPNRAAFETRLAQEVQLGRLNPERRLGLLILDIDRFKSFNDSHGHAVGDEVLTCVARCLLDGSPKGCLPTRFGGEEFVVIAPDHDTADLKRAAESIRMCIEAASVEAAHGVLPVTVSVGGASATGVTDDTRARALLAAADACLYEAKNAGRNRSICRSIDAAIQPVGR